VKVVESNMTVNRGGYTARLERGPVIRRVNVDYVHVQQPAIVARPKIEDFNSLVVVHDRVEYYT